MSEMLVGGLAQFDGSRTPRSVVLVKYLKNNPKANRKILCV